MRHYFSALEWRKVKMNFYVSCLSTESSKERFFECKKDRKFQKKFAEICKNFDTVIDENLS